ncbi:MAG TPA: zf-HC2 domain-containing protein, partial [Chloroflexia bacterium]|nr:zf-HC2 domain-containing protein [Chloroflexia bacterium]
MQQRGCEEMPLLISKYVDDAAAPEERERVDLHVASCESCACKLTEYMEMAAIFSEAPLFVPEAEVRVGVFREIGRMKEEERRLQTGKLAERARTGAAVVARPEVQRKVPSFAFRFIRAASPFAAASIGVLAILSIVLLNTREPVSNRPTQIADVSQEPIYPPVPTVPVAISMSNSDIPPAVATRGASIVSAPTEAASAAIQATATLGAFALVRLANATPVMESGAYRDSAAWHVVSDSTYGYTISYPPNWWTQARGNSRYFFPWGPGGTHNAPYYLDLRVEPNDRGLTAETANLSGACTLVPSGKGDTLCLRRTSSGSDPAYDEIYSFDPNNIYVLRVNVPKQHELGTFSQRWSKAQDVFSRMSKSVSLADQATRSIDYEQVLFLNGTDLWSVDMEGRQSQPITKGYYVRQFALSPDLRTVAFIATNKSSDIWAKYLYISYLVAGTFTSPKAVWSGPELDIHDIAWYGDHRLLAIANSKLAGLGVFGINLPARLNDAEDTQLQASLLVSLPPTMGGARGLSISPDRQLISFLAPFAENKGTDIYVVRPDGSDLHKLVSHADPLSPVVNGERVLPSENQAVKSYLWTDGRLESSGYEFNMLFTCGNSSSPSFYRGGFFYSAMGNTRGPLVDHNALRVDDPSRLQITHLAYSQ